MRIYLFAFYFYLTYLYYTYVINPIRIFMLCYIPDYMIYHYNKYVDLESYDTSDDDIYLTNDINENINCGEQQIYIDAATLLNTDLTKHSDITNKIILLAKMLNRINVNDIIKYIIKTDEQNLANGCNKKNYLYIRYLNHDKQYINKYINIIEKRNIISNRKLQFGNICT